MRDEKWEEEKRDYYTYYQERLRGFAKLWKDYVDTKIIWVYRIYEIYDQCIPVDKDDILRIGSLKLQVVESEEEIKRFIAALPKSKKTSDLLKI